MHDFFLVKWDLHRLAGSPETMSEELRPIWDLFNDVQERVDSILEIVQKQIMVSGEKLDQEAKQLLKRYRLSNNDVERDAP